MKVLWLRTTRVSAVIAAFVARYAPAEVKLDKAPVSGAQETWCTNSQLKRARDLSLVHNGVEVLGFHDGPRNMWAHESVRPFVEELRERKLLRFSEEQVTLRQGWLSKLVSYVFGV